MIYKMLKMTMRGQTLRTEFWNDQQIQGGKGVTDKTDASASKTEPPKSKTRDYDWKDSSDSNWTKLSQWKTSTLNQPKEYHHTVNYVPAHGDVCLSLNEIQFFRGEKRVTSVGIIELKNVPPPGWGELWGYSFTIWDYEADGNTGVSTPFDMRCTFNWLK